MVKTSEQRATTSVAARHRALADSPRVRIVDEFRAGPLDPGDLAQARREAFPEPDVCIARLASRAVSTHRDAA